MMNAVRLWRARWSRRAAMHVEIVVLRDGTRRRPAEVKVAVFVGEGVGRYQPIVTVQAPPERQPAGIMDQGSVVEIPVS